MLVAIALATGQAGTLAQRRSVPPDRADVRVTSPAEQFGHAIGADYELVNYTRFADYLRKLDQESDRLSVLDIGPTAEGRRVYTAVITSPENHRRLLELKAMNRRLALAEEDGGRPLDDAAADRLANEGKAVVWIDGGLHADEVLGSQQLIETVYQLVSRTDAETRRILDHVVVLCTVVNPDGMELVADWYLRTRARERRTTGGLPRLYQKYIGHDNNRDFYMVTQPETENVNRMLYREWFPVVVFDHHQTGPAGAVLFAPPFRDPFNYHFDPLVPLGVDLVGAAIHNRFAAEGKPGAVMRGEGAFSSWFNGGLRTTAYFHNQIGLLTETIGHPTPVTIPLVPDMQLPRADVPFPVAPQRWPFRRSVEYSVSSNYAVLDLVARRKDEFLLNLYRMARNAIRKGQEDTWTLRPGRVEAVTRELAARGGTAGPDAPGDLYERVLRDPAARDPRLYVLPSDQADFPTAAKFVAALMKAGVVVHRARAAFEAGGRTFPAGSYVVKTAQPFRAHVLDMFEPQDYPDLLAYPGGPPQPPYDVAGYTLAYSMGVAFDRILEVDPAIDARLERLADAAAPEPPPLPPAPEGGAYVIRGELNDAFVAINRVLAAGATVLRARQPFMADGREYSAGAVVVPAAAAVRPVLERLRREKGLPVGVAPTMPEVALQAVRRVRIGLWDRYGGSIASGWLRWLLEQFEFPYEVIYARTLDAGQLAERFDVLLFPDGGIPARDGAPADQPQAERVPREYRARLGHVTVGATVPQLARFADAGGTILAIGSSTVLASHLRLPVAPLAAERLDVSRSDPLFIPGSLLEARIDRTHPLASGMSDRAIVFFDGSPAFRLTGGGAVGAATPVAWFDGPSPLRSGWALGQDRLAGAAAVVDVRFGKGRVVLFGTDVAWRAQTHGTFKLLFNALFPPPPVP
ncbi:MAG: M14 family zinc carboxypeptidase [Vicinamibacterales bacterium]